MKLNLFGIASLLSVMILGFLTCSGGRDGYGRNPYYSPRKLEGFNNTFIKFKFSDKSQERDGHLNKYYSFYASYVDWKMLFLSYPSSFHPEREYWRSYYVNFDRIPEGIKNPRFDFLQDCEYRIPTSSGKIPYRFTFLDPQNGKQGYFSKEMDLPPEHSIRLEFRPIGDSNRHILETEELSGFRRPYTGYEIVATIEPSGENEPIRPCEAIHSQE